MMLMVIMGPHGASNCSLGVRMITLVPRVKNFELQVCTVLSRKALVFAIVWRPHREAAKRSGQGGITTNSPFTAVLRFWRTAGYGKDHKVRHYLSVLLPGLQMTAADCRFSPGIRGHPKWTTGICGGLWGSEELHRF